MVELHWTRPELTAADPADVAAIRMALFAKSLAPTVAADFAGQRRQIEIADYPVSRRAQAERSMRTNARAELQAAEREQARVRELLELDAEDEPDTEPDELEGLA